MMVVRTLRVILLGIFLQHVLGCAVHDTKKISKEDLQASSQSSTAKVTVDEKIVMVVYPSGDIVLFDNYGGQYLKTLGVIRGRTTRGDPVEIDVDDISYIQVETINTGESILASVGITSLVIIGLAVLSMAFSCPYIYSFDGERYVFDAEPLGGSICRGMERTDYSRLEHLRPIDGKYRLMVRNETDETQYIDETKLIIADHPRGSKVVPSYDGSMHVIKNPVVPRRAVDERGNDLGEFLKEQDGIAWQSEFPRDDSYRGQPLRHELIFEFAKPQGVETAKLVVNAGTALWGSNMIKEMLQLRGDKVDAWYESINTGGPAAQQLINFNVREELYFLRFYLKEGDDWRFRGWIPAGGPLVTEDRAISVDLSGVAGEKVTMRVCPPMGFWTIDYVALEFDDHPSPQVHEVRIKGASDQDGGEVVDLLSERDDKRQVMPRVGDRITLEFEVPPRSDGTDRSVFLKTTGYYEIHIDKKQPEQTDLIAKILATEGMIVEYSMDKYLSLYSRSLSRR